MMSIKYNINVSKGININDLKKVEVFGYGLFEVILAIMKTLDLEYITEKQATAYRDFLIKPYTLRKSGRRHRFGTPIPGARPIELKRKPCKGCKDKEK